MKKYGYHLFIWLTIFLSFVLVVPKVEAVSIADFRKDLAKIKEEKRLNEENSAATQAKIAEAKRKLENISTSIEKTSKDIEQTEKEIKDLEEEIAKKEQQIKDLVVFLQLSNGENFYLKYIFGAESFTDLIYRVSVIEQLTTKNDQLVDEMNGLITENNKKITELEGKKVELNKLNDEVLVQIQQLGSQSSEYFDEGANIDERIASAEKQIQFYVDQGCDETEDISYCTTSIPPDSKYIRPTKSGVITDNYGWREYVCPKCSLFHKGVDIGGNNEGTPVYAVAAGKVAAVDKFGCGGRVLTIDHVINGENVATRYWHLYSIDVKAGDIVMQGQQVATVGGGNTAYYDSCSTGAHLHFEVLTGRYSASIYPSNVIDPRLRVSFPAYGVWW